MRKTMLRGATSLAVMVVVLTLLAFPWSTPARAGTFTVTNTDDSGAGSLRQAILDANVASDADTVTFGPSARGTITLASTLTVAHHLTIEGPGAEALTISGNNLVRPLYVDGTSLDLSGVTLSGGKADGATQLDNLGGAIFNEGGILTVHDSALRNNSATERGGAIYNINGRLNVTDSTLSGNTAPGGGAVYNQAFFLTCKADVARSTLSGNSATNGGAIYNSQACTTKLHDTRIEDNAAKTNGGGLYNFGEAEVRRSGFYGNTANHSGGGIDNMSELTVEASTFANNAASYGGGIRNGESYYQNGQLVVNGNMTLTRNTFVGNLANRARNLFEAGESGGSCNYNRGGGLYNGGVGTITSNTFSKNHAEVYRPQESCVGSGDGFGGGIATYHTLTARNNIVAGNTGAVADLWTVRHDDFIDAGFNIVGGTAEGAGLETDADGNPVLADNGGPTETVALSRGGKAVDGGNSSGATSDQRGTPRPKDYASVENVEGGDGSDVGAFEYIDPDASPPTVEANTTPEGGLNNSDVTVSINASDETGGSGVWRTSYSASGAQEFPEQSVSGDSAELVVSAEGETVVTYWATDRAGNRSVSRTLTVRVDTNPPAVTRTTPKGEKVRPRANVTATFSEAMDPGTLKGTAFTLTKKGAAAPVPARITYFSAPAAKAKLDPARKLKAGATYRAKITTGATDEAGNALAANKVWTFTVKR